MSDAVDLPDDLPVDLERFLDEWLRAGADGDWAALTPMLSDAGAAPGAGCERGNEGEPSPSPGGSGRGDGSLPSTSGDDWSEKGESNAPAAPDHPDSKPRSRPGHNASRERMKNELSYLRQRALELETQLAGLKSRSSADDNQSEAQDVGLRSVWKQIAERQLERRRHVESENDRLKGMLTEYLSLALRLEQFLYKRPRSEQLLNHDCSANMLLKKARMASTVDVDDVALVQRFVRELGDAFAVADSVLEVCDVLDDAAFQPVLKSKAFSNGGHTHKAVWLAAKKRYERVEFVTYDVDHPKDTIAAGVMLENQNGIVDIIVVIRRYVSKGRMVWVWRSLTECSKECKRITTDETGWSVFQPAPPIIKSPSSATIMQTCVHVVPIKRVTLEPFDPSPSEIAALSARVRNTYVDVEAALVALTADLLIDEPEGLHDSQ